MELHWIYIYRKDSHPGNRESYVRNTAIVVLEKRTEFQIKAGRR